MKSNELTRGLLAGVVGIILLLVSWHMYEDHLIVDTFRFNNQRQDIQNKINELRQLESKQNKPAEKTPEKESAEKK